MENENLVNLTLIETDDIAKVNFAPGQYIIVNNDDDNNVYFDPSNGTNLNDRRHLNPKPEIDIIYKANNETFDSCILNAINNNLIHPKNGDLLIVKDSQNHNNQMILIYNNNDEDLFDDATYGNWCVLYKPLTSSDVYFNRDIQVSEKFSDDVVEENGNLLIKLNGKTLDELIRILVYPEKIPMVEQPKVCITMFNKAITTYRNYETYSVLYKNRTQLTPEFKIIFFKGSYEFDLDTGVSIRNLKIVDSLNRECSNYIIDNSTYSDKIIITGSFNSLPINDQNHIYKITVKLTYDSGIIPHTKNGNEYLDGRIIGKTNIQTNYISAVSENVVGYEPAFYYKVFNEVDNTIIDAQFIQNELTSIGEEDLYYDTEFSIAYPSCIINVPIGTTKILIANSNRYTIKDIVNVTVGCSMLSTFGAGTEVSINDSPTNIHEYTYWTYTPAHPYENYTELKVIFNKDTSQIEAAEPQGE